jgi:hypothetical protein
MLMMKEWLEEWNKLGTELLEIDSDERMDAWFAKVRKLVTSTPNQSFLDVGKKMLKKQLGFAAKFMGHFLK